MCICVCVCVCVCVYLCTCVPMCVGCIIIIHVKVLHISLQFFRQKTRFLGNNGAFSKLLYGILPRLISTIKLYRNRSKKAKFISTTSATLTKSERSVRYLFILTFPQRCYWPQRRTQNLAKHLRCSFLQK